MTGVLPLTADSVAIASPVVAQVTAIEASLLAFVVFTALATALARDVLAAVIVFGAYSLGMAALYTFYRAPDVALTEAAISAGVTTVLLLLTLAKTTRIDHDAVFESVNLPPRAPPGSCSPACCSPWAISRRSVRRTRRSGRTRT